MKAGAVGLVELYPLREGTPVFISNVSRQVGLPSFRVSIE